MGTLSMTASDLHTKCHRPPDRCSDLLGDTCTALSLEGVSIQVDRVWHELINQRLAPSNRQRSTAAVSMSGSWC